MIQSITDKVLQFIAQRQFVTLIQVQNYLRLDEYTSNMIITKMMQQRLIKERDGENNCCATKGVCFGCKTFETKSYTLC